MFNPTARSKFNPISPYPRSPNLLNQCLLPFNLSPSFAIALTFPNARSPLLPQPMFIPISLTHVHPTFPNPLSPPPYHPPRLIVPPVSIFITPPLYSIPQYPQPSSLVPFISPPATYLSPPPPPLPTPLPFLSPLECLLLAPPPHLLPLPRPTHPPTFTPSSTLPLTHFPPHPPTRPPSPTPPIP